MTFWAIRHLWRGQSYREQQEQLRELQEAGAQAMGAILLLGCSRAVTLDDEVENWRDHMPPILTDAYDRLERVFKKYRIPLERGEVEE